MVSCLLLTAGLSLRFGSPKALAKLAERKTVIEHLQSVLIRSSVDEIIVVLGAAADSIKTHLLNHSKVRFVYNKDYILGQTTSVQCGLKEMSRDARGFLLWPVDCPFVRIETVDFLVKSFQENPPSLLIPTYQGRRGHPPVFDAAMQSEILAMGHGEGINSLYRKNPSRIVERSVDDPGILATFNTPLELAGLVQKFPDK